MRAGHRRNGAAGFDLLKHLEEIILGVTLTFPMNVIPDGSCTPNGSI